MIVSFLEYFPARLATGIWILLNARQIKMLYVCALGDDTLPSERIMNIRNTVMSAKASSVIARFYCIYCLLMKCG